MTTVMPGLCTVSRPAAYERLYAGFGTPLIDTCQVAKFEQSATSVNVSGSKTHCCLARSPVMSMVPFAAMEPPLISPAAAVYKENSGIKIVLSVNSISLFYIVTKNLKGLHNFFLNSSNKITVNLGVIKL